MALGAVLAPLNSTMIAVAVPGIDADLAGGAAATSWLVTGYLIAMASLQPVAGRLGDRLGRRRLILVGLCGFGLASLGATFAPTLPVLILCRVAQGVAGAVVLPNGDALLREIVPDERRASRFGMLGSAIGLAAAIGPPLGGILVSTAGWRTMFAVNLLLVVPALILGWRAIPGRRDRGASGRARVDEGGASGDEGGASGDEGGASPTPTGSVAIRRADDGSVGASLAAPSHHTTAPSHHTAAPSHTPVRPPFDWPGAIMLSTVLIGAALLLSRGTTTLAAHELALAGVALLALLAVFLRRELRHPQPILQPRFFARPAFAAATGAVCLSNLAMYTVLLAIPMVWAREGRPAAEIGALLGIMAAGMFAASPVGGRLADRLGRRWPAVGGLTILTLGTVQIAWVGGDATVGIAVGLALLGGGLGLAAPSIQTSALEAVERQSAGAAAGAYSTSRYLGSIVGSALLAGLVSAQSTSDGLNAIFAVVIVAAGLSALLALRLPHRPAVRLARPT